MQQVRRTMKMLLAGSFAALLFFFFSAPAFADGPAVFIIGQDSYTVGSQSYPMDASPFVQNDRTYVPIRFLANALGVPSDGISWDPESGRITLASSEASVSLTVGSDVITVGSQTEMMDVPPVLVNGRTFLPAYWIAKAFGATVSWDPSNQAVTISPNIPATPPPPQVLTISPSSGVAGSGDSVTIYGSGFLGATAVEFGDLPAGTFNVLSDSTIQATEPLQGSGTVDVTVVTPWGVSAAVPGDRFTFTTSPAPPNPPSDTSPPASVTQNQAITLPAIEYPSSMPVETTTINWQYGNNNFSWSLSVPVSVLQVEASLAQSVAEMPSTASQVNLLVDDKPNEYYLSLMARMISQVAQQFGWDKYQEAQFTASFVQQLKYVIVTGNTEYPTQTIETGGDCINKSVLLVGLLKQLGYTAVVLTFDAMNPGDPGHAAVGIDLPDDLVAADSGLQTTYYYQFGGRHYYYCETTSPGWEIGETPDSTSLPDVNLQTADIIGPFLPAVSTTTGSPLAVTINMFGNPQDQLNGVIADAVATGGSGSGYSYAWQIVGPDGSVLPLTYPDSISLTEFIPFGSPSGTYTLQVTVTDSDGETASTSVTFQLGS